MDTVIALAVFFCSLVFGLYNGISIIYPLLAGLAAFLLAARRRGYGFSALLPMMAKGARQSFLIIKLFTLIGVITAVWRAAGTIPFIVYHAVNFLHAAYFILAAFLLCAAVSFLLGTSFGTVGTVGVILAVLAKSGGVDINVIAGAVIAGAFFGDRSSPMSSSANLVAVLTGTDIYTNLKNMFVSSAIPFSLAVAGYAYLSDRHRLEFHDDRLLAEIAGYFDLGLYTVIPAVIIVVLAVLRVNVQIAMLASIAAGFFIGVFGQGVAAADMLTFALSGYNLPGEGFFAGVIQGGGILSMAGVSLIVLISSTYAGIFAGTGLLKDIERLFAGLASMLGARAAMIAASIVTAAFSCNQTLAVMLTHQLFYKIYRKDRLDKYKLALDMENSVIVISPLIPWNIAGAVPAAILATDAGFIPYALYLWLLPLYWLLKNKKKQRP